MPELPDVEGFRRLLESHVVGKDVTAVEVFDPGVVRGRSAQDFVQRLEGHRFGEPDRHGKWLLAPTDGPTLLFHFGMTGSLVWNSPERERLRFDRVVICVESGRLVFRDQRKLRGLWLADDESGVRATIGEQGPDALGLSARMLEERLAHRRGALEVGVDGPACRIWFGKHVVRRSAVASQAPSDVSLQRPRTVRASRARNESPAGASRFGAARSDSKKGHVDRFPTLPTGSALPSLP